VQLFIYGTATLDYPYHRIELRTDQTGTYNHYVMVKQGVASGALNYQAFPGSVMVDESVSFTATANVVNNLERTFTVKARKLTLYGMVTNRFASGELVPTNGVTISDAHYGRLCSSCELRINGLLLYNNSDLDAGPESDIHGFRLVGY
jgi:hypothetical protein